VWIFPLLLLLTTRALHLLFLTALIALAILVAIPTTIPGEALWVGIGLVGTVWLLCEWGSYKEWSADPYRPAG
jgi:hypothetical protein